MHNFEDSFPQDFRADDVKRILSLVTTGKMCQLICIPGVGKATLLKLLAHNKKLIARHLGEKSNPLKFVYINLLGLTKFEEEEIVKFLLLEIDSSAKPQSDLLLLKKQLKDTLAKLCHDFTVVLLFDHFDEIQANLTRSFYQLLRDCKNQAKYMFSVVFATRRDLQNLVDDQIVRDFWDFFVENLVYLKVYDGIAADFLFGQIEEVFSKKLTKNQKEAIINLTGGHAKLTKVITELMLQEGLTLDTHTLLEKNQVRATLFEIWLFLTSEEQNELYLISLKKPHERSDVTQNLIQFDIIDPQHDFTIPIFKEFVANIGSETLNQKIELNLATGQISKGGNDITEILSPQEYRLLKFLIEKEGQIVGRDDIISAVWPKAEIIEAVSDEAIDQMVFRLRKKIENEPKNPKHVLTVKGKGIKFTAQI